MSVAQQLRDLHSSGPTGVASRRWNDQGATDCRGGENNEQPFPSSASGKSEGIRRWAGVSLFVASLSPDAAEAKEGRIRFGSTCDFCKPNSVWGRWPDDATIAATTAARTTNGKYHGVRLRRICPKRFRKSEDARTNRNNTPIMGALWSIQTAHPVGPDGEPIDRKQARDLRRACLRA